MNHGAGVMSENDKRQDGPDDATERELIEMEFQSMVENLSLDESAPTSYLALCNLFAMRYLPSRNGKTEKTFVMTTEQLFRFVRDQQPRPNLHYCQVLQG